MLRKMSDVMMPKKMSDVVRELEDVAMLPPGFTRGMMPADWVPPPLPHGITIEADPLTDNILVANEALGFCISRAAIDDNIYLPMFRESLAQLVDTLGDPALTRSVQEAAGVKVQFMTHLATFEKAEDLKHRAAAR
jgi:hypothetical protein